MTKVLVVRNLAQKVLWEQELAGQISDGQWENARPHDHYRDWSDVEVRVGGHHALGRNFVAAKDNYNFTSTEFINCVGDRMIDTVREQLGASYHHYTLTDLRADLKDLKAIIRHSSWWR